MTTYDRFMFKSYDFDSAAKTLKLTYSFDDDLDFSEIYYFDFEFTNYNNDQLDRALQNLFFMAGVSYYKAYETSSIEICAGSLGDADAWFFAETYRQGLGEFYYVNGLDPASTIPFTSDTDVISPLNTPPGDGILVGLGGGKDSLVSVDFLSGLPNVATWSLGHGKQLSPLIAKTGLPHLQVNRTIDPQLLIHNQEGARNGHVPISAILACAGTVVGILSGHATGVVSNENSANEPTLQYRGSDINHQFSKSLTFEISYQSLLQRHFGDAVHYFSLLRPLSELAIAELFAQSSFAKYADVFSSCNRAFRHGTQELFWCGECPKCAFVCLALAPFVERSSLEALWGKNLLLEESLTATYRQLLGIDGDKPLECVGEIAESRFAMRIMQKSYPELSQYIFDLETEYNYRELADHSMPADYYDLLLSRLPGSANNIIK